MRNALGAVQSALVLGGGSDIAQATMRVLVRDGCRTVVLAARDPDRLRGHQHELTAAGATTVDTVAFDALEPDGHEALIDKCFADHPDIDLVLIAFGALGHNAGIDSSSVAAAENVAANYVGAVSVGLAAAQRLRDQGHGTLVVLSSVAGERARRSNFVYGSSKAGLDAFAQGLGDALVGSGVRGVVVRPGLVHSTMTTGPDPRPSGSTPGAVAHARPDSPASGTRRRGV